jgi:hypothetical protein
VWICFLAPVLAPVDCSWRGRDGRAGGAEGGVLELAVGSKVGVPVRDEALAGRLPVGHGTGNETLAGRVYSRRRRRLMTSTLSVAGER